MTNKQLCLRSAIQDLVPADATLHFSFTHNRSHGAAFEVARALRGRQGLRLVGTGLLDLAVVLAAAETLHSVEGAFAGLTYPTPAPSRSLRELVQEGRSDPNWTNHTITLRLMAGALGMPAIPTLSLSGTDLEIGPNRAVGTNPFTGQDMQLIAPLTADVAIVHVPVADTAGNARVEGPFGEDLWGIWGADRVIVTADKVVSPDALREWGPGPGIPADRVDAVVEVPYGAHPQGQYVWNSDLPVQSYAEDYAFRRELRRADRSSAAMAAWLQEWVFDVDHMGYLSKLGDDRLARLRAEASVDFLPPLVPYAGEAEASPQERAATVALRHIEERLTSPGYASLFAGIGLSHLAAWAAVRKVGRDASPQLVAETGMSGLFPVPGDPYLFNFPNTRGAVVHDGFLRMLGAVAGRTDKRCLTVLSAGQVDRTGAMNSSRSDTGGFIVGSGGANDLANRSSDTLIVMPLAPARTPETVDMVTSRPQQLVGLACDFGLLEPHDGDLVLTHVIAEPGQEAEQITRAREQCGWNLAVAPQVNRLDPPTSAELTLLRSFDPERDLLI